MTSDDILARLTAAGIHYKFIPGDELAIPELNLIWMERRGEWVLAHSPTMTNPVSSKENRTFLRRLLLAIEIVEGDALLPCPFCRKAPTYDALPIEKYGPLLHRVSCSCGIGTYLTTSEEDAKTKWNRRLP